MRKRVMWIAVASLSASGLFGCASPQAEVQAPNICTPQVIVDRPYLMFFDPNSARLTPRATQVTDQMARGWLQTDSNLIDVLGNTDAREAVTARPDLSLRRAMAVKARLVEDGIDPQRILTRGLGASRPLVPTDGPEAQNRRVEPHFEGGRSGLLTGAAREECRTWLHEHCFRTGQGAPGSAASCEAAWDASPRW